MRNKKINFILTVLFLGILVLSTVLLMDLDFSTKRIDQETEGEVWRGKKSDIKDKKVESISIPGMEYIELKTNQMKQSVSLYNPQRNNCYFKISLLLADRTLLWQSKLIEPGKGLYEIELNQTLEKGVYEKAILKYECFTFDEKKTIFNGSEVKIRLLVTEENE